MTERGLSLQERFERHVQRTEKCWLWTASTDSDGYGTFYVGAHRIYLAHRVAWELYRGPIPEGMCVLHSCDNPPCVNPEHLFLGTQADNGRDKANKGRQIRGSKQWCHKLTENQIFQIRELCKRGYTQVDVARFFGVGELQIRRIVNRKVWKHI